MLQKKKLNKGFCFVGVFFICFLVREWKSKEDWMFYIWFVFFVVQLQRVGVYLIFVLGLGSWFLIGVLNVFCYLFFVVGEVF